MVMYVVYNFGVERLINNNCRILENLPENVSIVLSKEVNRKFLMIKLG